MPSGAKCARMTCAPSAPTKVWSSVGKDAGIAAALAPALQQIEQPRRGFAEKSIRIGLVIAEHARRRLVDQADALLIVDHQDALAQMLHDVLRELREIREVDLLAAQRRLALADAVGERPGEHRDREQHHAQHARRGVFGDDAAARSGRPGTAHQHGERRHRGDKQRVAMLRQGRHGEHRQHEQMPKPLATPPLAYRMRPIAVESTLALTRATSRSVDQRSRRAMMSSTAAVK